MNLRLGPRATRRAPHVLALLALLGLLLAGSLAHVHAAGEPGLYNHDHDLTAYATFGNDGGLVTDAAVVAFAAIVIAIVAVLTARPATAPRRPAASRGPPVR